MGLSFKINNPTGRYRSFSHIGIDIKLDKKKVGCVIWRGYDNHGMRVVLHVKDDTQKCGWKNITLAKTFDDQGHTDKKQGDAAKQWLKDNWAALAEKYPLYPLTD